MVHLGDHDHALDLAGKNVPVPDQVLDRDVVIGIVTVIGIAIEAEIGSENKIREQVVQVVLSVVRVLLNGTRKPIERREAVDNENNFGFYFVFQ